MEKITHKHFDSNQQRKLIFSIRLCEFLLEKDFKMLEFAEHKDASGRLIFVFENSNELHYAIDDYMAQKS